MLFEITFPCLLPALPAATASTSASERPAAAMYAHPRACYQFTKQALERGKSVCTSNKELVAKHGPELLQIAREHNCNYLFEASVGGGIPIIRPLNYSLTAEKRSEERRVGKECRL